jgi:hypothetical protein
MMEPDHCDDDGLLPAGAQNLKPKPLSPTPSAWASQNGPRSTESAAASYGETYEVPIHDDATDRPPNVRTPRTTTRSRSSKSKGTSTLDNDSHSEIWNGSVKEMSIPDRIASTALAGTVEFLKQVGGVTLSTTGALVAPPLHITRTVLLPNLFAALKDFVASHSPARLKDWFRIFSSSIYHIFNTLQNTETGHVFSNRLLLVLIDILDCLSADTTRQLLLDTMSCLVKFFEVLQTPSFQSYCEQLAIAGNRLIDALSNGRNKLLLHDLQQAAVSAGELLADPATTVALAEVTAYLCYALEMEDQQIQIDERQHGSKDSKSTRARNPRRKERDGYQRAAVVNRETLDTGFTVEEVLLSSLGVPQVDPLCREGVAVPSSILVEPQNLSSSIRNHCDDSLDPLVLPRPAPLQFHERARSDVHVQVLREGIHHRAMHLSAESNDRTAIMHSANASVQPNPFDETTSPLESLVIAEKLTVDVEELGVVYTVDENNDNSVVEKNAPPRRKRTFVKASLYDDEPEEERTEQEGDAMHRFSQLHPDRQVRKEGESANEHFYRILDEILAQKRNEAVENIIATEIAAGTDVKNRGSLRVRGEVPANGGTIKERLLALRSKKMKTSGNGMKRDALRTNPMILKTKEKRFILAAIATVVLLLSFWFGMGCYGIFSLFQRSVYLPPLSFGSAGPAAARQPATQPQEVVIRVVKEVVHVNAEGTVMGKGPWKPKPGGSEEPVDFQKVAECVAAVYN